MLVLITLCARVRAVQCYLVFTDCGVSQLISPFPLDVLLRSHYHDSKLHIDGSHLRQKCDLKSTSSSPAAAPSNILQLFMG